MQTKDVQNLTVAYIGGGSRGWAWGFMKDLAMDGDICGTVRLYDIDMPAAEANKHIGNKISNHPEAKARWRYEVSTSLQAALAGADFVVISILPGTFDEMESDVHLPERYGIYQSVGDTVGPGGFVRALRTLPMLAEIAAAVRDYAPEAWVINYTNPMSLCVRMLYDTFPGIRAFGCCHEVFGTQKLLAAMVAQETGEKNISREEIRTEVVGINHFTWLTSANYKGYDLFPLYAQYAEKYRAEGFTGGEDNNWMNNSFSSANCVKFDLFLRYGYIAAAGDRHLAEFMPPWYLKNPETVRKWKFGLTTVKWRRNNLQEKLARSRRLASGEEAVVLESSGEEGHLLMKSLLGLGDMVSNVNIPNVGQIANLPLDAVVETNALFRRGSILPVMAGGVPGNILPLVHRHVCNQESTLAVTKTYSYDLALSTFLHDPLVTIDPEDADALLRRMMMNTRKFLPSEWKCILKSL